MAKVLALVDGAVVEIEVSAGGSVPVFIAAGEIFAVPLNNQVLFSEPIDMGAGAEIVFEENSVLVEVN